MPRENVEVVRGFFDAMGRYFDAYWSNPHSMTETLQTDDRLPEQSEAFGYVHPEVEWKTSFLGSPVRGHLGIAQTWDEYLTWAADYRVSLEEARELDGDRVFAIANVTWTAKAGGDAVNALLYFVLELRDGLVSRIDEYTERDEALRAAGLTG